ncbi:uracil-DNA glycosylase-like [Glandiceps talaboti]
MPPSRKRKAKETKIKTKKRRLGSKGKLQKSSRRKGNVAGNIKKSKKDTATKARKESPSTGSSINLLSCLKDATWKEKIEEALKSDEKLCEIFQEIQQVLSKEYQNTETAIFPSKEQIFHAFNLTPLSKLKVVILGQDPYHDDGQAMGLAFSVPEGISPPPSLKNIYKELKHEYPEFSIPDHGCLEKWAEQGVLLLNATLTVKAHQPNSHSKIGWQKFTDGIIRIINDNCKDIVFILWGGFAQKKGKIIDKSKHHVVESAHPSPLSLNKFMKCGCFLKANDALEKSGQSEIDWTLL